MMLIVVPFFAIRLEVLRMKTTSSNKAAVMGFGFGILVNFASDIIKAVGTVLG
jgi:hypothetical protein